jgi:hypothetical protein
MLTLPFELASFCVALKLEKAKLDQTLQQGESYSAARTRVERIKASRF